MSKTKSIPPRSTRPAQQKPRDSWRPAASSPRIADDRRGPPSSQVPALRRASVVKQTPQLKPAALKPTALKHGAKVKQGQKAAALARRPAVSTPGLIGIGVVIGLTGHIVEQSRGEAWWSTQNAYAADAAMARQALLGDAATASPVYTEPAVAPPTDPDVDPRPPVLTSLTGDGPEQPAVSFLDGLELPQGLVIPPDPAIERYLNQYAGTPSGKEKLKSWLRRSGEYDRMVESALRKYRVPVALKALVFVESAFQPEAVSPAGASGMWQFMKATAQAYDLVVEPYYDQRFDPQAASNAAAKHLADLYEQTNDWALALAAYNYGLVSVRARLEEAGVRTFWELAARDDLLPKETRQYVPRIFALAIALSNLEHYGLDKVARLPSLPRTTRYEPPLGVPLSLLARAAGTSTNDLLKLNPQLRKGELPGAGDPVTLNVRGSWYARIQSTLPLLMAEGVRRRDLEVDANFDWGKDEFGDEVGEPETQRIATLESAATLEPAATLEQQDDRAPVTLRIGSSDVAPARGLAETGVLPRMEGATTDAVPREGVGVEAARLQPVVRPAPILGVGVNEVPQQQALEQSPHAIDGLAALPETAAGAKPIKASPILSVSEKTAAVAPETDLAAERRGLLPIRLNGQANRLNQSNAAQSFTPLGVTVVR